MQNVTKCRNVSIKQPGSFSRTGDKSDKNLVEETAYAVREEKWESFDLQQNSNDSRELYERRGRTSKALERKAHRDTWERFVVTYCG